MCFDVSSDVLVAGVKLGICPAHCRKNSCENHWMPEEMDVHVILSQEWANQLPAATEEERTVLRRIARGEAIRDTSRVASYIKIEPSSDG